VRASSSAITAGFARQRLLPPLPYMAHRPQCPFLLFPSVNFSSAASCAPLWIRRSLEAVLVNARSRFGKLAPAGDTLFLVVLGQDARQRFFDEPLAASTECNAYEQVVYRRAKFVEVLRRDGAHSSWGQDSVIVVTQAGRRALGFKS